MTHQAELLAEISKNISTKTTEIDSARVDITDGVENVLLLEKELKNNFENRKEVISKQSELKTRQSEIFNRVSEQEKSVRLLRSDKENFNQSFHEREIRLTTIESELRSISEKMMEEYELNISVMEISRPESEMTVQEAKKLLQEKKEMLKKFGAVNLLALEEYETASEREKFLNENLQDLVKAKKDLETTISKINQTAKQLFNDTFKKVEENFKSLFIELFSGGEAELRLEDPSDPLESNIEIIARPRGKKLLSITMMSGGERALTAISLLFSLYLVKPSPYCILDEIDAPLDDANCNRFLDIIHKFSNQTQFIAITHNKITMESASNLYGVTMEEPGISKLVGVKFSDLKRNENTEEVIVTSASEEFADEDENEMILSPAIVDSDSSGNEN